jgi:DnaJ-class molecular chaperone
MIMQELETICEHCNGEGGRFVTNERWEECDECEGKGRILTQDGKELLEFLSRHSQEISLGA